MTFDMYQWFRSSPTITESLIESSVPMQQEIPIQHKQLELELLSVEQHNQPLIKADVSKYKQASKAYGAATVYFSLVALFDPFFYPYAAVNFMGSLYYGIKSLQLPLKPVVLKDISIIPDELPY
jgi:hypothetical protein